VQTIFLTGAWPLRCKRISVNIKFLEVLWLMLIYFDIFLNSVLRRVIILFLFGRWRTEYCWWLQFLSFCSLVLFTK
jgi:hypothetical protein